MEAEPLKIDSPTDTDLTWGVVQKVARPDRINVRCVAIVAIGVSAYVLYLHWNKLPLGWPLVKV
ncbi:unnamed protein product, partial [marine sediment metagenome]